MSDEQGKIEYSDDDLLTAPQIGELIGRTGSRVRQLIIELDIPHFKAGRNYVVKYKDLSPIFDRNTIRGFTPPEEE